MGLSQKPNKFGLDPFLMCDTTKADYYYGRTDVEPDTEDGEKRALMSAAKGERPVLDKTLPWMLLARGMFKFLYKEAIAEDNKNRGRSKRIPGTALPHKITITPQDWAKAFNMLTFSYVRNDFFRVPTTISEQQTSTGRTVAKAILVQDPGKGLAKSESYIRPDQRVETVNILRRMETHRLDLGERGDVKKHLASLRDPEVRR